MEFEDILAGKWGTDKGIDLTTLAGIEEALQFMSTRYTKAQADGNCQEMNSIMDHIKALIVEREAVLAKQAESPTSPARIFLSDDMRAPPSFILKPVAQPPTFSAVNESRSSNASHAVVLAASESMAPAFLSAAPPSEPDQAQSSITTLVKQPTRAPSETAVEAMPVEMPWPSPSHSKEDQEPDPTATPAARRKPGRPPKSDPTAREGKGQTVSVVMPPAMVARIDELAASGLWRSRSDVIVYAMREYLKHGFDAAFPVPLPVPPKRRVGRPSMTKAEKQAAAAARKAAKATAEDPQTIG